MAKSLLQSLIPDSLRRTRVRPTETVGSTGTAVFGGFIVDHETQAKLKGTERYKTFSEMLANTSMVAAGTRYFLNLVAKASWSFSPSEADTDGRFAEMAEEYLTSDPRTPWHRIVRRAAMYRFYGFSVQEWTAVRREDGGLTFKDVSPRPQITIERWDTDDEGQVLGVLQRRPQDQQELYIPRGKLMYAVDDTLSDSPEGLGLFRHLAEPARRLGRFEQLEGFGFETDLHGVPIGRGPFQELMRREANGEITKADRIALQQPIEDFIKHHIKGPKLGLLLDSQPFSTTDDAQRPSSARKWDMELLKASAANQAEINETIKRLNHEIARVLGTEHLLLGSDGSGSLALSRDKSHNLFLIVDGTLTELVNTVEQDLVDPLWLLNGWPDEMKPEIGTEAVQFKDVEQISTVLRDMSVAGAVLAEDDPAIGDMRDLLGISRPLETSEAEEDAALTGDRTRDGDDPDELPEEDE